MCADAARGREGANLGQRERERERGLALNPENSSRWVS